ncbi:MAG TPA: cytochrome c biogenesis protein DipZ, partial [Spirochaetia bacterium]
IGIPVDTLRIVAVVLVVLFGLVMLVPWLSQRFELVTTRIAGRAGGARNARGNGFGSGIVVGLSLGLIWTPCVGPIMASVISLALTQRVDGGSVAITLAYSLGTAIPMLGVMLGGRALLTRVPALTRHTAAIQRGFGVLMIVMGVAIGMGWDRRFQAFVLRALPGYGTGLTAIEKAPSVQAALKTRAPTPAGATAAVDPTVFAAPEYEPEGGTLGVYGTAPAFIAKGPWFNTEGLAPAAAQGAQGASMPLTLESLRGKVVVVDFWTYSCVNCVRTLPYLRAWYDTYRDKGLVVVGVHTPEFEFEKSTANVARAIRDLGVDWPVVQDNDYSQWMAYANQYWPAHYFIDAKGVVRYFHYGEGDYDVSERVIQELLTEAGASVGGIVSKPAPVIQAMTPETYLGYDRARGFVTAVTPKADAPVDYRPAKAPDNGQWSLNGVWTIRPQYVVPQSEGTLELGFDARNVFLVMEPEGRGGSVDVFVDGKPAPDTADVKGGRLVPRESRMYQLVGSDAPGAHVLRLDVKGTVRLFAFTFG